MHFESLGAALLMDGHGAYVWSVALLSLVIWSGLLLAPGLRSRSLLLQQRGILRRQQAAAQREAGRAPDS